MKKSILQKDLLKAVGERPGSKYGPFGYTTFKEQERRFGATEGVDFNCGECPKRSMDTRCCCSGCAYNIGYLAMDKIPKGRVAYYLKHFDGKLGFWREGKGCILPRKYRSYTCVGYACRMEKEQAEGLSEWLRGRGDFLQLGFKFPTHGDRRPVVPRVEGEKLVFGSRLYHVF